MISYLRKYWYSLTSARIRRGTAICYILLAFVAGYLLDNARFFSENLSITYNMHTFFKKNGAIFLYIHDGKWMSETKMGEIIFRTGSGILYIERECVVEFDKPVDKLILLEELHKLEDAPLVDTRLLSCEDKKVIIKCSIETLCNYGIFQRQYGDFLYAIDEFTSKLFATMKRISEDDMTICRVLRITEWAEHQPKTPFSSLLEEYEEPNLGNPYLAP